MWRNGYSQPLHFTFRQTNGFFNHNNLKNDQEKLEWVCAKDFTNGGESN